MSDLGHLQERLRQTSTPDERFGITIGEKFVRDGVGGHTGKQPDIWVMRWQFHPIHETGTGQCVAVGDTVDLAMERFEVWLASQRAERGAA